MKKNNIMPIKLSIVVPVYNEKNYIINILKKVRELNIENVEKEIIVVDDKSTDGTADILKSLNNDDYKIIFSQKNEGKGSALRKGFLQATGDIIAIQDADLEYDPKDLKKLVEEILSGREKVVYGSRMTGNNPIGHISYYIGNKLISFLANFLYQNKISDVETCYKVFKAEIIKNLKLQQNDFAFEVEVTAKILKQGIKIKELPISYNPRKFSEGKKIKWIDGVKAILLLIKYRFD